MTERFDGIAGWAFEVEETSANVYRVQAISPGGQTISRIGTDVAQLVLECKADAIQLLKQSSQ